MKGLAGKVAVVTGGSSGIGQAIAIRLGQESVDVAINYVGRPEGAEETKDAIEQGVDICMKQMAASRYQADPGRRGRVARRIRSRRCSRQVLDEYGRIDVPHQQRGHPGRRGHRQAQRRRLRPGARRQPARRVPLRPAGVPPLPRLRPGRVDRQRVQRPSGDPEATLPRLLGVQGRHGRTSPTPSRWSTPARGVRVNGIGPGATITPINRAWIDDPVKRQAVESHIPMRRAGDAEEMAAATAFLCSDEAALHHRADAVRRWRPHALPVVRDHLVERVSRP